ncbi:flagellar hook-length control protein FliK [Tumebacillus sp. ITR2]|uniref:Flagellar hook-length control protein FliK n=1 Tax=Tumebacillus amylolyticus TaxID=2801339 RepID=A0ABS1JF53_9BACL|nr:flagellar hook-length control protein FliK [Tumebacillus amylolyticus]MBL0388878.1 flagellar hook-length control protein FliK [Tumebacillus amylolyticus]
MRISTGQMAKIMMQTLQGAKDAGGQLELKVGTVVRATLMEFLSNNKSEAWLMIGNTKVRAQVEAHLQPGDQLDLLVTGEQMRGALELKLVGQPMRGDTGKAMQMDLASILNALQVPEGDEMKAMVQEFVSRSLPLNPDVLKQAGQVLKSLGSAPTPAQVATLGKMAELGIPINPSTFQAMDALDNGPKLHQLLTSVAASLDNILTDGEKSGASATAVSSGQTEASKGASSPATGQTQGTGTTTQTATSATESNAPKPAPQVVSNASSAQATDATADAEAKPTAFQAPTSASPDVAEQPPTSTTERTQEQTSSPAASAKTEPPATHSGPERTQSAFPENKNSRPLPTQADGNAVDDKLSSPRESARDSLKQLSKVVHDLAKDANTSADSLRDKAKQLGLAFEERLGAALRRLPADSDASVVRDAVQNALNSFTTEQQGSSLKEALLNVQRSAAELTAAGHGALADDVSTLLNNLTGQQLMSTPGQTQQRSDLFYQFSAVPLQMNGREQTVELHVMSRKGPGQKSLDPSNCYVLFRLDMPNLGPLDIHLHIVDRVVGVRFVSEDKETVQIEAAEQRDLRDKLQGVGYHLGVLKVEEKQPLQEGRQLPLLPPLLTQSSLDLRM